MMNAGNVWVRAGGVCLIFFGFYLLFLSIWLLDPDSENGTGEMSGLFTRVGFAVILLGLFALFLYSERVLPVQITESLASTANENSARSIRALNLKGRGIYMPPGGRLLKDRVFIPLEDRRLELPRPASETVLNSGDLGPSLGMFVIPPGKDTVDLVESLTSKRFSDDDPSDAQESLERLTAGTGLIRKVECREKGDIVTLTILHSKMEVICSKTWKDHPDLHARLGCVGCSIVLTALARSEGRPLRIEEARREKDRTVYVLRRLHN